MNGKNCQVVWKSIKIKACRFPANFFHPFNAIKWKRSDYLETIVPFAPCALRAAV